MVKDYSFIREVYSPITKDQLQPLDKRCRTVQFSESLKKIDYELLSSFMKKYPDVNLRVYGHYSNGLKNLEFLELFSFIKSFSLDVWDLKSFKGIEMLPNDIRELVIGWTKSKAHSLNFLSNFPKLEDLYIEGHTKDIQIISSLTNLKKLTLRSITLKSLDILLPLKHLWYFDLKLGGTTNLEVLKKIKSIKYLELWRIKGLDNLNFISDMINLKEIFLQDLKQVKTLPSFKKLKKLVKINLENLLGLNNINNLRELKSLEEFTFFKALNFQPEQFKLLKEIKSLKMASVYFGSNKKNNQFKQMMSSYGIAEYDQSKSKYNLSY